MSADILSGLSEMPGKIIAERKMGHSKMKSFLGYLAAFIGILFAIWLALRVAGTDWSIPFGIVLFVLALVSLRKTA